MRVFAAMYGWRDAISREEDESTRYVLPNHMLFRVSEIMPCDSVALFACCNPVPPIVKLYATDIVSIVINAKKEVWTIMLQSLNFIQTTPSDLTFSSKQELPQIAADQQKRFQTTPIRGKELWTLLTATRVHVSGKRDWTKSSFEHGSTLCSSRYVVQK
jgi:ribonuclease D